MASTYLSRTPSSASNRKTWTWSAWVKRSSLGTGNQVLFQGLDGSFPEKIQFTGSDLLEYDHDISGTDYTVYVDRRFRDVNAWYHIVVAKDTTQSTETNRIKIYVNGEQQSLSEYQLGYPPQNYDGAINNNVVHNIGANNASNSEVFDGCMSHVHFCDGSALAPTVFGSTDSTTGEWKINTSPSFTPGTNGFTILKDGNTITDQSANSNNFSLSNGTLTKTEGNPSNVFCTYNPLQQTNGNTSFSNGNTYFYNTTQWLGVNGTISATSGKYYAEFKVTGNTGWGVGVADVDSDANRTDLLSSANNGYQSKYTGGKQIFLNGSTIVAQENNSTVVNNAGMGNTSFTANDIVMVALDLDNNNLFFGKNGTWLRGATESEIEAGTSTNATFSGTSFNDKFWTWSVTTEQENMYMNAGNGYFGTTAVSSAGTNASNNGIFEYDVPDGFTALSTKGLNE